MIIYPVGRECDTEWSGGVRRLTKMALGVSLTFCGIEDIWEDNTLMIGERSLGISGTSTRREFQKSVFYYHKPRYQCFDRGSLGSHLVAADFAPLLLICCSPRPVL